MEKGECERVREKGEKGEDLCERGRQNMRMPEKRGCVIRELP